MTTSGRTYPTRVACRFHGKNGQIMLHQLRTVDKTRLVKGLGRINTQIQTEVLKVLAEMFAEYDFLQDLSKNFINIILF